MSLFLRLELDHREMPLEAMYPFVELIVKLENGSVALIIWNSAVSYSWGAALFRSAEISTAYSCRDFFMAMVSSLWGFSGLDCAKSSLDLIGLDGMPNSVFAMFAPVSSISFSVLLAPYAKTVAYHIVRPSLHYP